MCARAPFSSDICVLTRNLGCRIEGMKEQLVSYNTSIHGIFLLQETLVVGMEEQYLAM